MEAIVGSWKTHLQGARGLGARARRHRHEAGSGGGRSARPRLLLQSQSPSIRSSCSIATASSCSPGAPGMFRFPHAIRFDEQGFAWLTDGHHMQFMKFTPDGELLQTIGVKGAALRYRRAGRRLQFGRMEEGDARRRTVQPADRYRICA